MEIEAKSPCPDHLPQSTASIFQLLLDEPQLVSLFHCGGGRLFLRHKHAALYERLTPLVTRMVQEYCGDEEGAHPDWTSAMIATVVDQMAYYALNYVRPGERAALLERLVAFVQHGVALAPRKSSWGTDAGEVDSHTQEVG